LADARLQRLEARMAKYGIEIKEIEEEEYCLIPMGGVLPRIPQRILGIGGTAGMVHPSTGTHTRCRAETEIASNPVAAEPMYQLRSERTSLDGSAVCKALSS